MKAAIVSLMLLAGSVCLMAGAILHNLINPSLGTALGIPLANLVSFVIALLATAISASTYKKSANVKLARGTMLVGCVFVVLLVALFPLSDSNYFGRVN